MIRMYLGLISLLIAVVGCDRTVTVYGTVQLDGTPVHLGSVTFRPVEEGASTIVSGHISTDGTYTTPTGVADGLKPGEFHVTIEAVEVVPVEESGSDSTFRPFVPYCYGYVDGSGLVCVVDRGKNEYNIALDLALIGRVTLDGESLDAGNVVLHLADGADDQVFEAAIQDNGSFTVRRQQASLPRGEYIVTVNGTDEMAVPERYSDPERSDLRYSVAPGQVYFDIKLTSREIAFDQN